MFIVLSSAQGRTRCFWKEKKSQLLMSLMNQEQNAELKSFSIKLLQKSDFDNLISFGNISSYSKKGQFVALDVASMQFSVPFVIKQNT